MQAFFNTLSNTFKTFSFSDALDILIVAYFTYKGLKLIYDIRAERLLKGVFILFLAFGVSSLLKLNTISWMLKKIFEIGAILLVIVFQPELRHILENFGKTKFRDLKYLLIEKNFTGNEKQLESLSVLSETCMILSKQKTGALIVLENTDMLIDIIKTGTVLKAKITKELLMNIFFVNTPLHDGAVIVRNDEIYAAGCILPLTNKTDIKKSLGTRHRAGIGMSENSDAIIVIVSEETGSVSVANNGDLKKFENIDSLNEYLTSQLIDMPEKLKYKGKWHFYKEKLYSIFNKRLKKVKHS